MIQITQLDAVPSTSSLLGARGTNELISSINKSLGATSFFGSENDRYAQQHKSFMTNYIEPIRRANAQIFNISNRLVNRDCIRPLTTNKDLSECPPCMMPALLTYEPVYKLLGQGRISGWGYEYDNLRSAKEQYDRLIEKNGVCYYGMDEVADDGDYWSETTIYHGSDPELSIEDRIAIQDTRDFIEKILKDTELDPTSLSDLRG